MSQSFSLIICTYMRSKVIVKLLKSVAIQTLYPDEILIIDGSTNKDTEIVLKNKAFKNLGYYKVEAEDRGLTKQRNIGISKVNKASEIVCFLDDDVVLEPDYFEMVIAAFKSDSNIVGVGGIAINEYRWLPKAAGFNYSKKRFYTLGSYVIKESIRNVARNYLGLQSHEKPGVMPYFSHGRTYNYPLTGQIYEVDLLVGMSFSFKRALFDKIKFSTYFEGYGLYEDADFSLRALQYGKNVISTKAKLSHYHDASGRPNQYNYGKMVVRNGWYVWRVKYPNPSLKARFKFHATVLLLLSIRATNIITSKDRVKALTETLGRQVGWISLIFNKPKHQ
ncbi:glycosyltransferase family 2 protein [Algibacter sp. Ld11]|uniref:glycosyltransferase family 2 protein n=1 Tax=Algibacter sp. Ld11 TaxID=649150 RepID=UPI00386FD13C